MWGNKTAELETPSTSERGTVSKTVSIRTPEASDRIQTTASSAASSASNATSLTPSTRSSLGASMQIKGEITGSEDLELDCVVEGSVRLTGRKLIVGANARIIANIAAGEVVVYGSVKGNVCGTERIEIKKNGSVVGELATARIMIEDGAYFKGTIAIDNKSGNAGDGGGRNGRNFDEAEKSRALMGGSPSLHLPAS
jgi:cytoskeletal protein CcmA (bactofilin family)